MTTYKNISKLIGNTPLVELVNYNATLKLPATLMGKLESMNPTGSIKDRAALALLEDAEERGEIGPGSVIIEPTSGNTGIGLAALAAARGYRLILTMPETMSTERRNLLGAYGAELVLTEGSRGMQGALQKANELASEIPQSYIPGQFSNPAVVNIHRTTTGPEIWQDTGGGVDVFVCAVGTGGTITGVGEYLKDKNPKVQVVAVEPASSPVLSGGASGPHKIQGIGAGFVPEILNTQVYDEIITVEDKDAFATSQRIAQTDGILVGISSGATLWAATEFAKRPEQAGKTIVMVFPDSGERYLSTMSSLGK